jgi:hypothetical protein
VGQEAPEASGTVERDHHGQAGRGRGDGPGQPDRAADVVRLRCAALPELRADLGDALVDVGPAQAEAERAGEGGLAPAGIRARVARPVAAHGPQRRRGRPQHRMPPCRRTLGGCPRQGARGRPRAKGRAAAWTEGRKRRGKAAGQERPEASGESRAGDGQRDDRRAGHGERRGDPGGDPVGHVVQAGGRPAEAQVPGGTVADHRVERVDGAVGGQPGQPGHRAPQQRGHQRV